VPDVTMSIPSSLSAICADVQDQSVYTQYPEGGLVGSFMRIQHYSFNIHGVLYRTGSFLFYQPWPEVIHKNITTKQY
jgi:hypothetical protein